MGCFSSKPSRDEFVEWRNDEYRVVRKKHKPRQHTQSDLGPVASSSQSHGEGRELTHRHHYSSKHRYR